jgi:hypothetical protein
MAELYQSNAIKYLRNCKNVHLIEETEVISVGNNQKSVVLQLKSKK